MSLRSRRITTSLFFLALVTVILIVPGGWWSPPPEAVRIGPVAYDANLSGPLRSYVPTGKSPVTDFSLSAKFSVHERPHDYAYILSTSPGLGSGIKISVDKYGNIFLSVSSSATAGDGYQLVKLSDPKPPEHNFSLDLILGSLQNRLDLWIDGKRVPVVEARPNTRFSVAEMNLDIKYIEVGGSDGHDLVGKIAPLTIVFGRTANEINLLTIRLIAIVLLLAFGLRIYAKREIGLSS